MSVISVKKRRKKRLKRAITLAVLLVLLAGAFYLFVLPKLAAGATTTYDSYTAVKGSISNDLSFSGSISVKNSETLSAGADGIVRKIYVTEEQAVKKDDKLMRLSTGETLKASFDGQVNEISVAEGDSVSANASLIQIVDFNNLKVSLRVDEYAISRLKVGQACSVNVKALELTFGSTISHINRIASSGGNTAYYTVTAEVSVTDDVLPGMQTTVTVPREAAVNAVILNKDALSFDRGNNAYVLVKAEDGSMEQKQLTVGVDNDNYVEVAEGLSEGEVVYKLAENTGTASGGLLSGLSSLFGGQQTQQTPPSGFTGFPGGDMPSDFSNRPNNRNSNRTGGMP